MAPSKWTQKASQCNQFMAKKMDVKLTLSEELGNAITKSLRKKTHQENIVILEI